MLNITTRQELLSRIVDTLGIVVEDARFDFDENGLSVRVVDPSHVAMVKLDVDSAVFDSWEVEETKIGLELKKLKETLGLGSAGDLLTMEYKPGVGDFHMNMRKAKRDVRPLDSSTINPPNLPDLTMPCSVTIGGAQFAEALRAAQLVGDLVTLSIDQDRFIVNVKGNADSVTVPFDKEGLQDLKCESPALSQYSLTYLVPLSKIFGSLESVTVSFGENFPLSMDFEFPNDEGTVKYFLAPRVESD